MTKIVAEELIGIVTSPTELTEKTSKIKEANEYAMIVSLYKFSMPGCGPCVFFDRMLFGDDMSSKMKPWDIFVKNFYEKLPGLVKAMIIEKVDKSKTKPSESMSYISNYVTSSQGGINEERIKELVDFFIKNFILTFVHVDLETDESLVEFFGVRAFPSFTICVESKILPENINYKNNKVGLKVGGFRLMLDFSDWFYSSVVITIDALIESILATWVIDKTNNY